MINPESKLGFEIVAIRNVYKQSTGEPATMYFMTECEGQRYEIGTNPTNESWELQKIYQFPITKGNEYLYVVAKDVGGYGGNDYESELMVVIDLKDLRDQKLHTNTYRFRDKNGDDSLVEIDCSLLWKYNLTKFFSDMIHEQQVMIDTGYEQNAKIHANIQELYRPFPSMAQSGIGNSETFQVFKKTHNDNVERDVGNLNPFEQKITSPDMELQKVEKIIPHAEKKSGSFISKLFFYFLIFYILVVLMTHLNSDLFLDLIVALLLLSSWHFNIPRMIKQFIIKAIVGISIALLFDIIWLCIYHKPWWSTGYDDSYSMLHFRRYIIVMTYILIVVRIIMIIFLVLLLREIKSDQYSSEFDMQSEGYGSTVEDPLNHRDNKNYDPSKSNQAYFDPFAAGKSYPRLQ